MVRVQGDELPYRTHYYEEHLIFRSSKGLLETVEVEDGELTAAVPAY